MRMRATFLTFCLLAAGSTAAQTPTGDQILQKVDDNFGSDNKVSQVQMVIQGRRGSRTVESRSWIIGARDHSFTEYLAPAREKGTKMLKLDDQLWTYTPSTDRIILISGHMLRQSVMGSDLSYEDSMEDKRLRNLYDAEVVGEESFLDRPCWVLELSAKVEDIAYHSRKIWVDRERAVVLKENRYAKSGKLLKTTEVQSMSRMEGRWVADRILFKDVLKHGEGTIFIIKSIQFDADIPEHIFSKASLRR